ncbi:MAG TPA: galactose-1-phosphate uridylyltransferase [Micromonosporaceae bacterium]|jgi:UDPglucose--hexose-1-phosphate uridylyltransferase
MHKTSTRLADDREIIYFDRTIGRGTPAADQRDLPEQTAISRVRYDVATGDWVTVAGHRQSRGFAPDAAHCPLCPSRDGRLTEIPAEDYEVVAFENRFPALTSRAADDEHDTGGDLLRSATAAGRCEVICFSSDHDASFAELKADQIRLVLDAWIDRSRDLSALDGVVEVFCFENRGPEMGVSQPHPHGQIYAYPFVTPRTKRMLAQAVDYRAAHGDNMFEALVAAEIQENRRVVRATDEWIAFVPFAARWPYEVHVYPRRRRTDLTGLDEAQRDTFATIYADMLQRFERLFDAPTPYVSAWHQAPQGATGADDFAVHVELFTNRRSNDRLKVLGGTEVAMDTFSNDIGPEQAAERLRDLGD